MQILEQKIRIPDIGFDMPITDLVLELEQLRYKVLEGTTHPLVFMQIKGIFHMLESIGSSRIEGNNTTIMDYVESTKINDEDGVPFNEQILEILNIEKATSFLWVSTQSGKIDVNIDTASDLNTQSYAEDQGIVNLKSNNGTINVNFANLLLKNYISSQRGTINCKFSPTLNFILNYTCPENAPSISDGITTGEAANEASIAIGNSNTDKAIYLKNLEGRTSIEDTYAA